MSRDVVLKAHNNNTTSDDSFFPSFSIPSVPALIISTGLVYRDQGGGGVFFLTCVM